MITIYFADLTHTTVTISNDSFPLNIGMVAAFAKSRVKDIEVQLFKYPDDLARALKMKSPDILALSNYPWNLDLGKSFLAYAKKRNPSIINIMGGPNISYEREDQERFLLQMKTCLDFYVMYEGETGFYELLQCAIANGLNLEKMKESGVSGSLYLHGGRLAPFHAVARNSHLEEYASPYLTGVLDKFFDDKLSPMIETHRGCPFTCSYCHEGHHTYNRVNRFKVERVYAELDYIGDRIGEKVKNVLIADPNFGMFDSDVELAAKIHEVYRRTGFPKTVFATTAKNSGKRLIEISDKLREISMPVWMSVQSMTDRVLANIKRKNIKIEDMVATQRHLMSAGRTSKSELILPLPGETFDSHVESLVKLINLKIGQIVCYQLMLVQGSELKMDKGIRAEHRFQSKFRVLPRSFSRIEGLGKTIEVEEIVVSTKDLPFDDYLKARLLHLIIAIFYNGQVFSGFFKFMEENKADLKSFLFAILGKMSGHHGLAPMVDAFLDETRQELFDSEAGLREYYSNDVEFEKLIDGSRGANLLQKYSSLCYMRHGTELVEVIKSAVLESLEADERRTGKVQDIAEYFRLSFDKFLHPDRRDALSKGTFTYDIQAWLASDKDLDAFVLPAKREVVFHTPDEQYQTVESYFDRYGRNEQAMGKILTRLWIVEMLRKPMSAAAGP